MSTTLDGNQNPRPTPLVDPIKIGHNHLVKNAGSQFFESGAPSARAENEIAQRKLLTGTRATYGGAKGTRTTSEAGRKHSKFGKRRLQSRRHGGWKRMQRLHAALTTAWTGSDFALALARHVVAQRQRLPHCLKIRHRSRHHSNRDYSFGRGVIAIAVRIASRKAPAASGEIAATSRFSPY